MKKERSLVCPFSRREIVVLTGEMDKEILCPVCNITHLLPDDSFHTMQELKDLNMTEISW